MISLKILNVKTFMTNLFIRTVFDDFLLSEFDVVSFNEFKIKGRLHKEWYEKEQLEEIGEREYSKWKEMKPIAYQLIKGKKTPLFMKIVFLLSLEEKKRFLDKIESNLAIEEVDGLFLNLRYEKENAYLTTGISLKIFSFDKTLEREWDTEVENFLKKGEVVFERI